MARSSRPAGNKRQRERDKRRKKEAKEARRKLNRERLQQGLPPVGIDGEVLEEGAPEGDAAEAAEGEDPRRPDEDADEPERESDDRT